ncbi:hypothetical protein CDAR_242781 [Caerostris darwini]|uniref:Ycf15 n=1 Tax=Caerostris darwini TaxID=1538125 RepID=A0AAV4W0W4_9ARAC|nr:hypothetical protein CDAR_242781 [Caerostris darwini]
MFQRPLVTVEIFSGLEPRQWKSGTSAAFLLIYERVPQDHGRDIYLYLTCKRKTFLRHAKRKWTSFFLFFPPPLSVVSSAERISISKERKENHSFLYEPWGEWKKI